MAINWQFLYIHEFLTSRVGHIESSVGNTLIWLWVRSRVVMGPASHAAGGTSNRFFLGSERAYIFQHYKIESSPPYDNIRQYTLLWRNVVRVGATPTKENKDNKAQWEK